MATSKPTRDPSSKRVPKVRIARPANRPFQLRYTDAETQKEIRLSVGSRDEADALRQLDELKAKLLLGIESRPKKKIRGPQMPWEEFREAYTTMQLASVRDNSALAAESRLDIAERILKPQRLADVANADALHKLQSELLAGAESRFNRPRAPYTVKTYMAAVIASLSWAEYMEWIPRVPKVKKIRVAKLNHMKGRPINLEEFERLLAAVSKEVGDEAADSWEYVLNGIWESGLRIGELMHVSWDDENEILPVWKRGRLPVLAIPHDRQKNAIEESIPLLPGFESLLMETPGDDRNGWVFNPLSLETKVGRKPRHERASAEWVGKVITRIGKRAGVVVTPAKGETPAKYASAHDLRRSLAERLYDAGCPEREVSRVMRHASAQTTRRHYAPGNVQKAAGVLREKLATQPVPIS